MEIDSDAVFILGAGASQEAGIKTSYDLTEAIRNQIAETKTSPPSAVAALNFVSAALLLYDAATDGADPFGGLDVERVFAAVQLLANRRELEVTPFVSAWHPSVDDLDRARAHGAIEDQLIDGIIGKNNRPPSRGRAQQAIEHLIDVRTGRAQGQTYTDLERRMVDQLRALISTTAKSVGYLRPLIELGRRQGGLTIATLNYDRSIEEASAEAGVLCDTGLEGWLKTSEWPWPDEGIRLLKIHGSIDWVWRDVAETGQLHRRGVAMLSSDGRPEAPALIFGHGAKLKAEGPFLELFAQLDRALRHASQVVCIGYSFRDDHVNELIRRWTGSASASRLTVVDPGWKEATPFYQPKRTFRDELNIAYGQGVRRATPDPPKIRLEIVKEKCGPALAKL